VLGSTCTVTASAGTITIGTTTVASGASGDLLYNNAGTLGNEAASALTIANTQVTGLGTSSTVNTGTSGGTIPLLNGTNVWSGQQTASVTTLTISTATFTPDGSNNNYGITLVHASCPCTLANPSATPVAGTSGVITVTQSSSGSDTIGTWGSDYEAPGGTASITLSTGASAVDTLSYYVKDSSHILLLPALNFSH
jgi:hypothetical protein